MQQPTTIAFIFMHRSNVALLTTEVLIENIAGQLSNCNEPNNITVLQNSRIREQMTIMHNDQRHMFILANNITSKKLMTN
jgi:hypothetical protein